jgi:hypothetical protein
MIASALATTLSVAAVLWLFYRIGLGRAFEAVTGSHILIHARASLVIVSKAHDAAAGDTPQPPARNKLFSMKRQLVDYCYKHL